jgi:aspartate/methionine/tyrosine aminotransferase
VEPQGVRLVQENLILNAQTARKRRAGFDRRAQQHVSRARFALVRYTDCQNGEMRLARRMSNIGVESAFDVLVRARALEATGRSVIHLEIGEPDFDTPKAIVEAAKKALDDGYTHYGPTQGLPELRQAIAAYISRTRRIAVGPQHICVVPGGKPIIFFPMLALLEPGDEVLYPDPGFPIYRSMIQFLDAIPVPVPLIEKRGFSVDLDYLKTHITARTKMLILNSPQNPTGGLIPEEDIRAIAELVRERDLIVLSDEIYARIFYTDDAPFSFASVPGMLEKTIILDGFSKTYAMTGWRLGYGVMPEWLVDAVNKLMVNSNSCSTTFIQRAALAAFTDTDSEVNQMVSEFRARRDAFCAALNQVPGFRCALPGGAFYAFPNIEGTGLPAHDLADLLLDEAGVAALSGESFGIHGRNYVRFSYANSIENLMEAVRRINTLAARWTR